MIKKHIIVSGDWHGVWGPVNFLIEKQKPRIILQCGDFGWWPKFHNTHQIWSGEYEDISDEIIGDPWQRVMARRVPKAWDQWALKAGNTKIYWCDGNHEDHWDLVEERNYIKPPCEMMPNVYYMKRGSTLKLEDGRTVLFMGGADSIDKLGRCLGLDWFPEELISQSDIRNLPDIEVDIIISHTCPSEFHDDIIKKGFCDKDTYLDKIKDPSALALSYILDKYKPSLWYFAHFHTFVVGKYKNTRWRCLNTLGQPNWWQWLED